MTNLTEKDDCRPVFKKISAKANWLFEVEPYFRMRGETLSDLRDNLCVRKALKRAFEKEFAPQSLIDSIRSEIRR